MTHERDAPKIDVLKVNRTETGERSLKKIEENIEVDQTEPSRLKQTQREEHKKTKNKR